MSLPNYIPTNLNYTDPALWPQHHNHPGYFGLVSPLAIFSKMKDYLKLDFLNHASNLGQ